MKTIKKMARVIAYTLLLCLMVTQLASVAEVIAAERKTNNSNHHEIAVEDRDNKKGKEEFEINDIIFKHLDKENFKNGKHISRYEDEEKLNTYVFGNADGSKTVYYMYENVKYKDKDGKIRDKDISLVKKNRGYGIVQNEVDLFLPENPSEGVAVNYSGYDVKIIPQGGNEQVVARQYNDAIIYDEYFDENTSLKYTPLLSGVKEDIILKAYAENVSYDFIIETNGLYIYNDDIGYYLADETNSKIIYYLGDVQVYDAIGKPELGEIRVSAVEEGQKYMITLSVSDTFLSDPETVYPVTIDPTLTISNTTTGADSIIDAPIFEAKASTNFGTYIYNTVGTTTASYGKGRTVVKLPGLTNSNEYKTVKADQITSVKFYVRDSSGTGKQTINLYPLTNTTWTETSVKWNNVGSHITTVNYAATLSSGKVTGFDITGLVKAWKNGTYSADAGFILINSAETNNKSFCSSEYGTASYKPYVEMTYTEGVEIQENQVSILAGSSIELTTVTTPEDTPIKWESSNTDIVIVDSSGVISGVNPGKATITATATVSGRTDTCKVTIRPLSYGSMILNASYKGTITAGRHFWYKFTPIRTGYYVFESTGTTDTYGLLYKNSMLIAHNDDDAGSRNFKILQKLDAGVEYRILVRGYSENTTTGDFQITVSLKCVEPTIKSREDWNAKDVIEDRLVARTREPERIVYHHSAEKFSSTSDSAIITEIQRIQNLHINNGKCDIAYHYIIDPNGNIWQGAEVDEYQRGHATGYFDDIGVLILGDFEPRLANLWNPNKLNQQQKDAMELIAKWLCCEYELTLDVSKGPIATHSMLGDTECPGDNCETWVKNDLTVIIENWLQE